MEDSFQRLARNGFIAGQAITVTPRAGRGLIVRTSSEPGSLSISRRKGAPLLSLEGPWVTRAVEGDAVRVRLSYRHAVIIPRIFAFSIRRTGAEAEISGLVVTVGACVWNLATRSPLKADQAIRRIKFDADWSNLILGTELIGNHRPSEVSITGPEASLAGAFLADLGYRPTDQPGLFVR